MADIKARLTKSSLQQSSIPTYTTVGHRDYLLNSTAQFFGWRALAYPFPRQNWHFSLHISLFDRNYASSTVNTYVSAIGYSHKLSGFPDPTRVFYIIQMLKGYAKNGARLDSRLPITLPILQSLLNVAPSIAGSTYQVCQFKAMCSLAIYAFLRIGELTATKKACPQPLQLHQIAHVRDSQHNVIGINLTFVYFKHNYNQRPFTLLINRQATCCPIALLLEYIALRGNRAGPLFITQAGGPVTREGFATQLSQAIRCCGLNPDRYKSHSFRIGAASYAAERGMSDAQIRTMGRWKSNSFHKCIRVPSIVT
jgi:hypothetical protein